MENISTLIQQDVIPTRYNFLEGAVNDEHSNHIKEGTA